ncbi:hypothetical protein, partial [Nonomuraea sp. K271]|uniref:hypothetical protein n=1 Tax=Nonomuraea sp. K271 TaxID=1848319 RepID=UPI00191C1F2C
PSGTPSPSESRPGLIPSPAPTPSGQAIGSPRDHNDRVEIEWRSIRELAWLFDKTGDDVVMLQRVASDLAGTSGLVGDDEQGHAFAAWYADSYEWLTESMRRVADKSFISATGLRDFEQLWEYLEGEIIRSLPPIPDLASPPIPQPPPPMEGA